MPIPDLLRDLLEAAGPTGREEPAAAVWRAAAERFAEVGSDTLGTSFARVRARGEPGAPTLALVGHVDEIGIQVTHVGENGLVRFAVLGGFDAAQLLGQRVTILGADGAVTGVVGGRRLAPGKRRDERPPLEHRDLHVDVGVDSREDAERLVRPGDAGVWQGPPAELANGRLASRALDNRLGCYVALETARRVAEAGGAELDVVAVAAVQEEIGYHGARTAAFALEPAVAVAIDVTWATDVPGGEPERAGPVKLGGGAAITLGPVVHPAVSRLLRETAEAEDIAHCVEVYTGRTGTDADAVHVARGGVPTGLVSVPVRYMHSPVELCALADVEAAVALLAAFALRLPRYASFLR